MRALIHLAGLLLGSVLLYGLAFGLLLDRPLSLGTLRLEMARKLAYAATQPSPRLILLAGSNAAFSHRCAIIGPMLGLPCINGGVAMGLALDSQFLRWEALLRPGDIVYLPMELAQYTLKTADLASGPDGAILLRHDRPTLLALGPTRLAQAVFSARPEDLALSLIEMAIAALKPGLVGRSLVTLDSQGDETGRTLAKAALNQAFLAGLHRPDPPPALIAATKETGGGDIRDFLLWATAHDVRAIGGWPTEFADAPSDPGVAVALTRFYTTAGAGFLDLSGRGRYRRADFYDTQDHLAEECQALHSLRVARGLAALLQARPVPTPPSWASSMAAACP